MGHPAEALAPPWSFACPDWAARLKDGRSLVPDLPLDPVEGDRAVGIFNNLRLPDVVGQPRMAEAAGDWFRDMVRAAFGSLDQASGRRNVSEIFALVPKKNSKTTGGAGVMLTAMLLNERPRAEMLFVGPTQEIADLAFQQAAGMIDADEYLKKRFLVQEHLKTIFDRRTKAKLKIKTFDMKVMTGSKPVVVLMDELHIMSTYSYASRVIGQIRGGLMANPESLLIIITTQSDEPPAGAFKAELQRARGIRDGRITGDNRMLPLLYEFSEEMQLDPDKPWLDPANWPMVLPNLGLSISIDRLLSDFKTANDLGEEEVRRWASQHLNVEIGMALHSDRWIGVDYWEAASDPTLTLETLMERCDVAVVGIDGGGSDDLLGMAVIGREKVTRNWLLWNKAWCQEIALKRHQAITERLRDFARDGDLVICTRPTQDIEEVAEICTRLRDAKLLPPEHAIGLDPLLVTAIIDELISCGIEEDQLQGVFQGYRLSGAVWGMNRKLADGTLRHSGRPMMNWVVSNAKAVLQGNALVITKQASGKGKIDPLMAAFDAVQLMSRNPEAARKAAFQMIIV
jgi:phage terminase large subunit-like protein